MWSVADARRELDALFGIGSESDAAPMWSVADARRELDALFGIGSEPDAESNAADSEGRHR